MILAAALLLFANANEDQAVITHDDKPCVTYRAQYIDGYLAVTAQLEPGWHTFTMDNDKRASAKLNGRKALSADKPTSIEPVAGLALSGSWLQLEPKDFSQPELRIFSWGFEGKALFAAPAKPTGASGPYKIRIKGQACSQTVCKNIDVSLDATPAAGTAPTKGLISVQ